MVYSKKKGGKRGVLVYQSGKNAGSVIKLRQDGTIFGRDKADVILDDEEISSTHFQIQIIDAKYHLFDMNSSNGTFVNHNPVVKAELKDGDVLMVGRTALKFLLVDEKSVRHMSAIYSGASEVTKRPSTIVDSLIERDIGSEEGSSLFMDVEYSGGKKETIELLEKLIYIGRASSFGEFDKDTEISRKHLMVKHNNAGEIFVEDQNSTNGTYLNGQKIQGLHKITGSDILTIGLSKIKLYTK